MRACVRYKELVPSRRLENGKETSAILAKATEYIAVRAASFLRAGFFFQYLIFQDEVCALLT